MIKADNGTFECAGTRGQLLLDYAFILDGLLNKAPEIVLAVYASRADNLEKAFDTADYELVATLVKLLEKYKGETK